MDSNILSLYYIFYMVASSNSISAAAEELFISQPAVSKNIKKLETLLGTTLLTRSPHGTTLTYEGQELYSHLIKAFEFIRNGENSLRHINELGIGHISIGVSSTLCKYLLLPKIAAFTKIHPHIQISIKCQSSADTLKSLKNSDIDLGIVAETSDISNSFHIGTLSDVFVASPEYIKNLLARDNISKSDILKHSNLILLNKGNITRQYVEQYLNKWSISTAEAMELNSMELIIDFAKTGLGVSSTVLQFVEKELAQRELILIDTPEVIKKRNIYMVTPSGKQNNPSADILIDYIQKESSFL